MAKLTKGSVFDHLGFDADERAALKMKAEIFNELIDLVEEHSYSSKDLQEILGVPQPRISELMNGRISKVSIEKLLSYLQALGKVPASLKFKKASGY